MKDVHTPCWRDEHGLVHIVGTHSNSGVWAECGRKIAGPDGSAIMHNLNNGRYEPTTDFPTCLMCLGDNVDYIAWTSSAIAEVGAINTNAIMKIKLED